MGLLFGPFGTGCREPVATPEPDPGGPTEPTECGHELCPGCFDGEQCADSEATIEGTCCAAGDPLVYLGTETAAEAVDIETDGEHTLLCGGFGVWIHDVSNPAEPIGLGTAAPRCQRAAFGDTLDDGTKVFYLAHHGDSWVPAPFLKTFHLPPDGEPPVEVDSKDFFGLFFEGLAYRDGRLYVALHDTGFRVYQTDSIGIPSVGTTLGGFDNATKIAIEGEVAYVADGEGGLKLVTLEDPDAPLGLSSIETLGIARDVAVEDARAYVALGGNGLDVFDVSDPKEPVAIAHLDGVGSVQGVDVDNGRLALASWSHVRIHDAQTLALLATDQSRPYPEFEQDLGIAIIDDVVYVAEWEALHTFRFHEGIAAPDIAVEREFVGVPAEQADDQVLVIANRGTLELTIDAIHSTHESFTVSPSSLRIPAGQSAALEIHYEPPGPMYGATLLMETNDPDADDAVFRVALVAQSFEDFINVGDQLDERFAFLDPGGQNQLSGLEGKVTVLAYFALF